MAGSKSLLVVLCVMVWLLILGSARSAADVPGSQFDDWKLNNFTLSGVPSDLSATLEEGLAHSGRRRLVGVTRPPFSSRRLQDDLRRIRLFLARKGYPEAQIAAEFFPKAAKRELEVRVNIQSGTRVIIESLEVRGLPQGSLTGKNRLSLQARDLFDQDIM